MKAIIAIFGEGRNLSILQMSARGIIIFLVALLLIRLSGRRSFGIKTPLDNIVSILLGAILSRAVVGASDFLPIVISCLVIVLIHRACSLGVVRHKLFAGIVEGEKMLLFHNGHFIKENMGKGLVCEEDIMQGVRKSALTDNLDEIDRVYLERNGEISALKKARQSNGGVT